MKVHVILNSEVVGDENACRRILDAVEAAGLRPAAEQPRLQRFGILSGEVEPEVLTRVAQVDGVQAVEPEGKKYTR